MSELIQKNDNRATIRWKLLTGASALALTAYVSGAMPARADDTDKPQLWIELGGQLSQLEDGQEAFSPPLMDVRPSIFQSSQTYEKPPRFSIDEEGQISFQPKGSDWLFSASIRYGRSSNKRHVHQQTYPSPVLKYYYSYYQHKTVTLSAPPLAAKFADTHSRDSERHMVVDFQAGMDVGLGLFGNRDASSVISAGVRFAQFASTANMALKSDPDWHFRYRYFFGIKLTNGQPFHSNLASMTAERSFHGVGPSVSWKASVPMAGNVPDGALTLDWGVNAAMLFGRQRAKTHHQSTARYYTPRSHAAPSQPVVPHTVSQFPNTPDHTRSRNVTVPNVGGSIGLSWRLPNFKVSMGYKADFFFNAIDGGIDARKSQDRGFYGPYASISFGLGD